MITRTYWNNWLLYKNDQESPINVRQVKGKRYEVVLNTTWENPTLKALDKKTSNIFLISRWLEIAKLERSLENTTSPSARKLLESIISSKKSKIYPSRMVEVYNANQKEKPLHEIENFEEMEMALWI